MRHGVTSVVCVCAALFGGHIVDAADQNRAPLHRGEIAFRCVKTQFGPMIEIKTSNAVVQITRWKVLAGQWFGEGTLRLQDDRVEWTGVSGVTLSAKRFLFNPVEHDRPRPDTGFSLRSLKTSDGRMVEVKARGVVAVVPSLMFSDGHREVEIHPIGDKLGLSDGKSAAVYTTLSFDL